jgi:hypothetical protein
VSENIWSRSGLGQFVKKSDFRQVVIGSKYFKCLHADIRHQSSNSCIVLDTMVDPSLAVLSANSLPSMSGIISIDGNSFLCR